MINEHAREKRDSTFDGLRAVAVLSVVGCHLSKLCLHWGAVADDFWEGACGAHLLLIASGFAMAATLRRTRGLGAFATDRISRIYPLYAFSIVVSAGLIVVAQPPLYDVTAEQLVANLTMFQSWLGHADIDGAYWLTGVLIKFYLLVGFAVFVVQQRFFKAERSVACVEKFAFAYLLLILIIKVSPLSLFVPSGVGGLVNVQHAHLMIAGALLWCIRESSESGQPATKMWMGYAACVGLELVGTPAPLGSLVIVGVMLVCVCRDWLPFLKWQPLRYIGQRLSFGIYMLHGVVGYVVMDQLSRFADLLPAWVLVACGFLASIVASELAYRLVESPCREWLRDVISTRREPAFQSAH